MTNRIARLVGESGADIDRLMYLYSDESSKSEETVEFWRRGLEAYCTDEKSFIFRPSEVSAKFIHKDMIPTSFDNSLTILRSRKAIVDSDNYSNRSVFQTITTSAASWIGSMLLSPDLNEKNRCSKEVVFVPLLRAVMEAFIQYILKECETNDDQILVVYTAQHCNMGNLDLSFTRLLQQAGEKLEVPSSAGSRPTRGNMSVRSKTQTSNSNITFEVGMLMRRMKESSVNLLEEFMVAEGHAVRSHDQKILKIIPVRKDKSNSSKNIMTTPKKSTGEAASNHETDGSSVTDVDVARLKLRASISQLERRITKLDGQVAEHKEKAIGFKKQGNDSRALTHLKLKKVATDSRDKSSQALVGLVCAFEQIETAEFSALVTGAYVTATSGLRSARICGNLSPSTIDDASDAFNEELDCMAEIDDSMQEANKTVFEKANIDEDELCKELEALMTGAGHAPVRADSKWGSRAKVPVGFLRSTDKANSFSSSSRATVTADRSQDGRTLVGATANRSMSPHRRRVDTSTVQKRAESASKKRAEPPFY